MTNKTEIICAVLRKINIFSKLKDNQKRDLYSTEILIESLIQDVVSRIKAGESIGTQLEDAYFVTHGTLNSAAIQKLKDAEAQFADKIGQPVLCVSVKYRPNLTPGKILSYITVRLGILNDKTFAVNPAKGECRLPITKEVSADFPSVGMSADLFLVASNLFADSCDEQFVIIGLDKVILWFRDQGGNARFVETLYVMAEMIGLVLPEIDGLPKETTEELDKIIGEVH